MNMASNLPAPAEQAAPAKALPTFKEFLETSPPDVAVVVTRRASGPYQRGAVGGTFFRLFKPELDLHCETCDGTRAFKCTNEYGAVLNRGGAFDELNFECKNCKDGDRFSKRFCLAIIGEGNEGPVQKI